MKSWLQNLETSLLAKSLYPNPPPPCPWCPPCVPPSPRFCITPGASVSITCYRRRPALLVPQTPSPHPFFCSPSTYILYSLQLYWSHFLKDKKASDTLTRSGEESSFWQHWYWQRVFQHWYWRKFLLILTASRRPIKLSAHSQLAGNLEIMHGWKNYQIIKNQWLFWIFPLPSKQKLHLTSNRSLRLWASGIL